MSSRRECRRQSLSAPRHLSSIGLAAAGDPSCSQPSQRRDDRSLLSRRQRANPRRCGQEDGSCSTEREPDGRTGQGDRRLSGNADGHFSRSACRSRAMRFATVAAALLSLLSLFAWIGSLRLDTTRFDRELKALDDFARFERGMSREVLTARTGLSRNYDALVRMTEAYEKALDRLREVAAEGPAEGSAVAVLAAHARRQQDLVEKFKSRNAMLQNSFAYFGMFNAALAESNNAPVAGAANQLSAAMLHLTMDTSSSSAREVQEAMSQLAALQGPSSDTQSIRAVLAHGGMLHDLLPATDSILKMLMAEATTREQDALSSLIAQRQRTAKASAGRYGFLLYVASLGLLG